MEQMAATNWSFFQNELRGFIFKRVKDKSLTDDIIQDVFLKAQSKIGQLQASEKFAGWIYQITKNTIIDHFRKQPKTIHASDLDWDNDVQNFNECVSSALKELLPTLPEKYREAIQLTEMENLSQIELADRLGISYSGAKSRVQRARQMLKEKMDEILIIKTDSYGNAIVCRDRGNCC
jgi:RNA polymerase sigma-70 factor (ECF subfamily)